MTSVKNIVIAGLGGQGVLKASDILAEAAFRAGFDVKKAEVHGMSQRGGSVSSDVRYGDTVLSPMVPEGEAEFLVVLDKNEVERNRPCLATKGELISAEELEGKELPNPKGLNVTLLGMLSAKLEIAETFWLEAIRESFPEKLYEANVAAFNFGRFMQRV